MYLRSRRWCGAKRQPFLGSHPAEMDGRQLPAEVSFLFAPFPDAERIWREG